MIVTSEAMGFIENGAVFAKMQNKLTKDIVYWLKFPSRNGFEIPNRTGRTLEKYGYKPKIWQYDV